MSNSVPSLIKPPWHLRLFFSAPWVHIKCTHTRCKKRCKWSQQSQFKWKCQSDQSCRTFERWNKSMQHIKFIGNRLVKQVCQTPGKAINIFIGTFKMFLWDYTFRENICYHGLILRDEFFLSLSLTNAHALSLSLSLCISLPPVYYLFVVSVSRQINHLTRFRKRLVKSEWEGKDKRKLFGKFWVSILISLPLSRARPEAFSDDTTEPGICDCRGRESRCADSHQRPKGVEVNKNQ